MSKLSCIRTAAITLAILVWVVPGAAGAPQASIGSVSCDVGGSVVTLSNDGGVPVRFVVLRDDAVIASVVVPAGAAAIQRTVPIAEGAAAQVTARFGASYASSYVRRECGSGATAAVPATSSATAATTDAGSVRAAAPYPTAPVIPATGARTVSTPASPAPAAAPATSERVPQLEEPASVLVLMLAALAALAVTGALLVRLGGRREAESAGEGRRQEAAR